MTSVMQQAFQEAREIPSKPSKKAKPKLKLVPVSKPATIPEAKNKPWDGSIPRSAGSELLVIFNGFIKLDKRIQVRAPAGGSGTCASSNVPRDSCKDVRLHLDSLLRRWSVKSVNVVQVKADFMRVFVSFVQDQTRPGLNIWHDGAYGKLLRELIDERIWAKATAHWNEGKPCISLMNKSKASIPGMTLFFR